MKMNCFDTENSNAYTCNFITTFDISYIFDTRRGNFTFTSNGDVHAYLLVLLVIFIYY